MCGRYCLTTDAAILAEIFGLTPSDLPELAPRFNIAPTKHAPVVRAGEEAGRRMDLMHWGLIPFWAKDPTIGSRMINARSETAAEKPAYRNAIRRRRCLVPADGFYEWKKISPKSKQPYFIHARDDRPLALAGLWDRWKDKAGGEDNVIESFTILTTQPNRLLKSVHDRMPVIIGPEGFDLWLSGEVEDPADLQHLFQPVADDTLAMHPVSRHVNSPANDDAKCIEPAEVVDPKGSKRHGSDDGAALFS
ncbi:MAG: SOS response-associated peptidase [Phycisphaerales bacterium]|nr:MAG: SOS response-associated peptidase [Phycisphaerales bacterium]